MGKDSGMGYETINTREKIQFLQKFLNETKYRTISDDEYEDW
jgi:hypothetical protein